MYKYIFLSLSILLSSCVGPLNKVDTSPDKYSDSLLKFKSITKTIEVSGLNSLSTRDLDITSTESTLDLSENEWNSFSTTVKNPDFVFSEISKEENATDQIKLIDSILNEGTAEDVYLNMKEIDTKLADNYETEMQKLIDSLPAEETASRGLTNSDGKVVLSKIQLRLGNQNTATGSRGLAKNFEWDTILFYVGNSAATTAGILIYKFTPEWVMAGWFPVYTGWLRWVGLAAAYYCGTNMLNQIYAWSGTGEVGKMISFFFSLKGLVDKITELYKYTNDYNYIVEEAKKWGYSQGYDPNLPPIRLTIQQIVSKISKEKVDPITEYLKNLFGFSKECDYGWRVLSVGAATVTPITVIILTSPEIYTGFKDIGRAWNKLIDPLFNLGVDLSISIGGVNIVQKIPGL